MSKEEERKDNRVEEASLVNIREKCSVELRREWRERGISGGSRW